jgi:hypothetical protein
MSRFFFTVAAGTSFWIGVSDEALEGHFLLLTTGNSAQFTMWGHGEPNNDYLGGEENCVIMEHGTGTWNDAACLLTHSFICEHR